MTSSSPSLGSSAAGGTASEPPPPATQSPPHRTDGLAAEWREYYRHDEDPRHPGARDFLYSDVIEALRRLIPEDASVLEVGSGSGRLLAALPNKRKAGIDYLPERVEKARRDHPEISFEVADATELGGWGAGSPRGADEAPRFDAIICDRLCHSVVDIKALLESLRGRLSPGGRVYLTVFNYLWELPTRVAELAGWKRPAPTSNWLSDHDLKNLFDIAGLEVVRYEDRLLVADRSPGRVVAGQPVRGAVAGPAKSVPVSRVRVARSRRSHRAARRQRQRRRAHPQRGGQRSGGHRPYSRDGNIDGADLRRGRDPRTAPGRPSRRP